MYKTVVDKKKADKEGYPHPGVFWGRRTKKDILKDVPPGYIKSRITARNEVTRWYADGVVIVRYHLTDILVIFPNGMIVLNTGGWLTRATHAHLEAALKRNGIVGSVDFTRKLKTAEFSILGKGGIPKRGVFDKAGGIDSDGNLIHPNDSFSDRGVFSY